MLLSVATPEMAGPERRVDMMLLLKFGLPIFLIVAVMIAYGDRIVAAALKLFGASAARGQSVGMACQTGLTMLLTLSAIGRIVVFAGNGVGQRPRLGLRPPSFHFEPTEAEPRLLLCATLMMVIFIFLARASWVPFLKARLSS